MEDITYYLFKVESAQPDVALELAVVKVQLLQETVELSELYTID